MYAYGHSFVEYRFLFNPSFVESKLLNTRGSPILSPEWTLHQSLVHQSLVVVRPAAVTSLMGAGIVEIHWLPAHVETVSRQRWPRTTSAVNKNNSD